MHLLHFNEDFGSVQVGAKRLDLLVSSENLEDDPASRALKHGLMASVPRYSQLGAPSSRGSMLT